MFLAPPPDPEKRLSLSDTFAFSCHSGLSCFNQCCRNKYLPLTPYDVLRMRKALGLHSDKFLERYAVYGLDPASGFPILSIRMDDADGRCPFLSPKGCSIYQDRPMACRLYPLGRSCRPGRNGTSSEVFFHLLDTPHCQGIKEDRVRTVAAWQEEQGLLPYLEVNDRMLGLLFHPKRDRALPLTERQQQKVLVACYNIDVFKEFIVKTGWPRSPDNGNGPLGSVMENDSALLAYGFAYLDQALFP
ncbi:MAG: YkgJ family cysteine cluster protein [Deltaproteobacteria bacterium]|nr:YkgJ family cysteine cluster protein [Deltaproteobacteria bacterium]